MPCSSFWPGPECGFHGMCVTEAVNGSINSFCKCNDGWEQSLEWNPDEESLNSSICAYNEKFNITLWALCLIFAVPNTLGVLRNVRSLGQLWRRKIYLLINTIAGVVITYRLARPDEALMLVDITWTVLVGLTGSLMFASSYLFLTRYLAYISSKVYDVRRGTRAARTKIVFYYMMLFGAGLFISLSATFLIDSRKASAYARCVLGYFALFFLYQTIFLSHSLSNLLSDMEIIVDSSGRLSSPNEDSESTELVTYFQAQIPIQRRMKKRLLVFGVVLMTLFLLPAANPKWLLYMSYFLPASLLIYFMYGFIYFVSRTKRRRSNPSSTSAKAATSENRISTTKLAPSTAVLSENSNFIGYMPEAML